MLEERLKAGPILYTSVSILLPTVYILESFTDIDFERRFQMAGHNPIARGWRQPDSLRPAVDEFERGLNPKN